MVVTVDKDIKLNDLIANILYDNADTNNAIFLDYAYLDELVGVLGANGLAVVLKIISLNGEGITPSVPELSMALNIRESTVRSIIKELRVNECIGDKMLRVKLRVRKTAIKGPQDGQKYNAVYYLKYFMERYEDVYNVPYAVNFGRDSAIIKDKLIGHYTHDEIITTIDYIVKNYDFKWKRPGYQAPTITALGTWLFVAALNEVRLKGVIRSNTSNNAADTAADVNIDNAINFFDL